MSTEESARRRTKVVGLVGRAGSGKSSFAEALRLFQAYRESGTFQVS